MVHRAAAVGFQRAADAYERGRPGYPPQIVEWLLARLGRDVLDLAAGTGKLTRELLAGGARVTAVEPVEAMRAALPASAGALDGTAEAIPLACGQVDGVVVAQAWHWFDAPRALAEIHRVLRPEGCLAVVYNRRDMDDPLQRELEDLVMPYRADAPSYRTHAFDGAPLFAASGRTEVRWTHTAELADRIGSISFIAALEPGERERVLDRARALGPVADLAYRCEAEAWTRLSVGSTDSP